MANESPKVLFSVSQDFVPQTTPEATIPFFVIFSGKGPLTEQLVDLEGFEVLYGKPDTLKYGVSALYAYLTLQRTGGVAYVRRAIHSTDTFATNVAKYSGATVRWILDGTSDRVIEPLTSGLSVAELAAFNFPSSADDRQIYLASTSHLVEAVTSSTTFKVTTVDELLSDAVELSFLVDGTLPNDTTPLHTVTDSVFVAQTDNYIKTTAPVVSLTTGMLVRRVEVVGADKVLREIISPSTLAPTELLKNSNGVVDLLIDDNDAITDGMEIAIVLDSVTLGIPYVGSTYIVHSKYNVDASHTLFTVTPAVTATATHDIYVRVNTSIKEKDAFLVTSLSPGEHNDLSISIDSHPQSDDLFYLTVMKAGFIMEGPYTCSRRKDMVDAYGKSQYISDVINGYSRLVWITDNPDAVNPATNIPYPPLTTNYMVLTPDQVPNYVEMDTTARESVLSGDSVISVVALTSGDLLGFSIGQQIALTNLLGTVSLYTISAISINVGVPTQAEITISGTFTSSYPVGTNVRTLNGYITGPNLKITGNDTSVTIGDAYTYNNSGYTVYDAGSNWIDGGQDGLIGNYVDFLAGFENVTNIVRFPEELLIHDGGQVQKEVFVGLHTLAETRKRCHVYGSIPDVARNLTQGEYVSAKVAYADSTLTTGQYSSIFAGWSQIAYGAGREWVSDSIFEVINQYQNTLIQEGVLPAANNRGKITGILEKDISLDSEFLDQLEKKQINYAQKVGAGYTNMSNTTRFNIDSYFQYRHICHYINAVHSIVESVFQPYLQEVVTANDVDNVDTAIGNLLTRQLSKMTESYETHSTFLSNGNGTTTWKYKLLVQPRDVTTKILFDMTVTNKSLEVKVVQA